MIELRCSSGKLHGILIRKGIVEIKCNSPWCGARSGVAVFHRFHAESGALLETRTKMEGTQK